MKETFFYQVRQEREMPLTELFLLVRQAFISLYPGTAFDEELTELYGTENLFFLSRTGRTESIAVFITADMIHSEMLAVFSSRAAGAEKSARKYRHGLRDFLVSVVCAKVPDEITSDLTAHYESWSLFEYLLLQSETEEGLALKPVHPQRSKFVVSNPRIPEENPASTLSSAQSTHRLPERALSSDELSALIDLSLGLEMRARGIDWEESSAPGSAGMKAATPSGVDERGATLRSTETGPSDSQKRDESRQNFHPPLKPSPAAYQVKPEASKPSDSNKGMPKFL